MDGQALVQWTSGEVLQAAAEMDGVGDLEAVGGYVEAAAAEMDGATDVAFAGRNEWVTAAQMDGQASAAFGGAVASGHMNADGAAALAWTGRVTGGFYIGAAAMNGSTDVEIAGVVSIITPATAHMDGAASMLAVQSGTPLPPHGR